MTYSGFGRGELLTRDKTAAPAPAPVETRVTAPPPAPTPTPTPVSPPPAPEPLPTPALPARSRGRPKVIGVKALATGAKAIDLLVMGGCDRAFAAGLINWLLQETCGKVVKTVTPRAEEEDSDLDILLRRYRKLHLTTTSIDASMGEADHAAAKRLLDRHGLDMVTRQMRSLAAIDDEFVRKQGFTFPVLQRNWSRLAASSRTAEKLARRDAPAGCRHEPLCQTAEEHSRRYLRELRGSPSAGSRSNPRTTSKPSAPSSEP